MTMTLIETKTLGSAAASIEFTSIPQDATDLYIVQSVRFASDAGDIDMRFNGSTTGYSMRLMYGNGSGNPVLGATTSGSYLLWSGLGSRSTYTANTFGNSAVYIPNYTSSATKSVSVDSTNENNAETAFQIISAGLWTGTAAITSIAFSGAASAAGNLVAGSTISLYKITKGSSGGVVVS
jgi:hypothetical protein